MGSLILKLFNAPRRIGRHWHGQIYGEGAKHFGGSGHTVYVCKDGKIFAESCDILPFKIYQNLQWQAKESIYIA